MPARSRLVLLVAALAGVPVPAAEKHAVRTVADIVYANAGTTPLALDLYIPVDAKTPPPLIVYVHGGAWRSGSKAKPAVEPFAGEGFAVASIDYRLSPVAPFPAQVHDIKAAIRFLRARQREYGYDARRIAIAGTSAGAHLAALTGVTNGVRELEGSLGDDASESSAVQAILSYFGASNLTTILQQSTPHGVEMRVPALKLFLGALPAAAPDLARLASPVFHVDRSDPPLLLFHGDQDAQMPINQSHELHGKYKELGLPVQFEVVHGAGHGAKAFFEPPHYLTACKFLDACLRQ
jgi:acetyl esterase/lipase